MARLELAEQKTVHYIYLNNVMSRFIAGLADYFRTDMFPRTKDIIISNYSKAVEYIRKKKGCNAGGENWSPSYPYIVIDPQMDFAPDDPYARAFHNYPTFGSNFAKELYSPYIYKDNNVEIAPVLNRYRGSIEIIIWCSSIYEQQDYQFWIYQFFGGLNRPIYPKGISGIIAIDDTIRFYDYNNQYTGEEYLLDWDAYGKNTDVILIRNINQNMMCFPFEVLPFIKLTGVSDGGDKYDGGGDVLGENRINLSIEWECSIPTHLILTAYKLPPVCKQIQMDIFCDDYKYIDTQHEKISIPEDRIVITSRRAFSDFEETIADASNRLYTAINDASENNRDYVIHNHKLYVDNSFTNIYEYYKEDGKWYIDNSQYFIRYDHNDLSFERAYNYYLTENDISSIDSSQAFDIVLENHIEDCVELLIFCKEGYMDRDYIWKLKDNNTVTFYGHTMKGFNVNDIITFAIYGEQLPQVRMSRF